VDPQIHHDTAMAMADAILEVIGKHLRQEERRNAFGKLYRVCHEGIETYTVQKEWLELKIELGE
jgi:hypothetical protein